MSNRSKDTATIVLWPESSVSGYLELIRHLVFGLTMIKSTLTRKWQTTIPVEVRKALGLKPGHRLIYELIDGGVLVRVEYEALEDLYGCLADGRPSAPKADERNAAREARVARYR